MGRRDVRSSFADPFGPVADFGCEPGGCPADIDSRWSLTARHGMSDVLANAPPPGARIPVPGLDNNGHARAAERVVPKDQQNISGLIVHADIVDLRTCYLGPLLQQFDHFLLIGEPLGGSLL